jgi:ferredoxin
LNCVKKKINKNMTDITIHVEGPDGSQQSLQAPTDMGLSLMEFLKGNEYDILATCGGMALCATCHVEILSGAEQLPEIGNDEYAMLDTLPNITDTSRLSCQLRLTDALNNVRIKIMGDGL